MSTRTMGMVSPACIYCAVCGFQFPTTHIPENDKGRCQDIDSTPALTAAIMAGKRPPRRTHMYKELHFDTWGTLVDNYSIADVIEQHVYESHLAQKIAQDWRKHQKWAMFYTTLADNFVIHPGLNNACLKYALEKHNVQLSKAAMDDICNNYHKLRAYPEVVNA